MKLFMIIKRCLYYFSFTITFLLLKVPLWDERFDHVVRCASLLLVAEIKQIWQRLVVRQFCCPVSKLVKEWMLESLQRFQTLLWIIF